MADASPHETDAQPRESFYVNAHATGWWWYQNGAGYLNCFDGRLRFEQMSLPLVKRLFKPGVFEHTSPRIVLANPTLPIPGHYTVIVFEQGKIAVSVPGNYDLLRTTLTACGFEIVQMPERKSWPRKLREIWTQLGTPQGTV